MVCAAPITAQVFTGSDNALSIALRGDDGALMTSLAMLTRATLTVGATVIDSATAGAGVIRWTDVRSYQGVTLDVVTLQIGGESLAVGTYAGCVLTVYSADKPNGVRIATPIKLEVVA